MLQMAERLAVVEHKVEKLEDLLYGEDDEPGTADDPIGQMDQLFDGVERWKRRFKSREDSD